MKKTFIQIVLLTAILMPSLIFADIASAQEKPQIDPWTNLQFMEQELKKRGIQLINPALHAKSAVEEGASEITSTIWYLIDYIKYFIQGIAVIVIIAGGVMFITAGKDSQKKIDDAKRLLTYGIASLAIVTFGAVFVEKVFFGATGSEGTVLTSEAMAEAFGKEGSLMMKKLYEIATIFVGAIAVLMIIINGVRIAMSFGDQESRNKSIKRILYAVAGLLIVGIAEFVVKGVLFPDYGAKLMAADRALMLIKGLTNFISAFVAVAAFVMLLYAGYMYVMAGADPDSAQKAKKTLVGSIIGLILAAGAYALVNTFIKVG